MRLLWELNLRKGFFNFPPWIWIDAQQICKCSKRPISFFYSLHRNLCLGFTSIVCRNITFLHERYSPNWRCCTAHALVWSRTKRSRSTSFLHKIDGRPFFLAGWWTAERDLPLEKPRPHSSSQIPAAKMWTNAQCCRCRCLWLRLQK